MQARPVRVAVAVIKNAQGQILLALRGEHQHQGGLWEFPGGKIEPNESFALALARELDEEIGISVTDSQALITIKHHYADKTVLLEVHLVTNFSGAPVGREGQQIDWVDLSELRDRAMPAANRIIVNRLLLPDRYLITPELAGTEPADTDSVGRESEDRRSFLNNLKQRLALGDIQLMQLRAHCLSADAYVELAQQCLLICRQYNVKLLLNAEPSLLDSVAADGIHLTSQRLSQLKQRPLSNDLLLAASCHNQQQLELAASIGVDMAVLGPVLETSTHPEAPALGWPRFQALVADASLPVYALGGMQPDNIAQVKSLGAQGIAAISGLWHKHS